MRKKHLLIVFSFLSFTGLWAQPNWSVNESDYQYSMTLIAKLNVDGRTLNSENDRVGAFVNGEIRGVATPSYVSTKDNYFTYLTVFSNQQGETVSFRLYDASSNGIRQVEYTMRFVANKHTGSLFRSISLADPPLNTTAEFEGFSFVNVPLNDSIIAPPNYTYYIPNIISKETLVPEFVLSEGATAYIDRRKQISGQSVVDFTQPVTYQIISQDESTLNTFTFTVEHSFDDYDGDGLEDEFDLDDDDDCYSDALEEELGSNPLDGNDIPIDTNQDCLPDSEDYDNDGIPNTEDTDDDGDCYSDEIEMNLGTNPMDEYEYPPDANRDCIPNVIDFDGDGIENELDPDDDNDCFSDALEEELETNPFDANDKPEDIDGDCIADVLDNDVGNDGFEDDTLFIDQFFSPNGDGINDTWKILNIGLFQSSRLWVFSRTGKLVLDVTGYKNDWNGTNLNQDLPEGNYYYRIDQFGNGQISHEGWVYLSR